MATDRFSEAITFTESLINGAIPFGNSQGHKAYFNTVLEALTFTEHMSELTTCNTCFNKGCSFKPKWGTPVRYNCAFHKRKDE